MSKVKVKTKRTSLYLREDYLEAMRVIKEEELLLQTHQIEMALRKFLEQKKDLLLKNGIDLWKQ